VQKRCAGDTRGYLGMFKKDLTEEQCPIRAFRDMRRFPDR
jgi:hypothetical protein